MKHNRVRRMPRRLAATLAAALPLLAVAALVAGCGSLNKTTSSAAGSTRSAQVLYTVKSGDLVETASGRVSLTSTTKGKVTATVQVAGSDAAQVAAGQSVTVSFIKLPAGFRVGANGRPSGSASPGSGQGYGSGVAPSGAPSPASGGYSGGSGGYSGGSGGGGQGFFGGGGGQGALLRNAKQATATVTAVQAGSSNSVTATISIAKLPSGVTTKYTGFAQITVKVLASNVLIVPRAAIKGSGSSATVQLLKNGKTVTQSVTVGQENQTEAEITSGLSAGDSILYTRSFSGFPGTRRQSGQGYGGYGGYGGGDFSGGQGGSSNGQSTNSTGGV